MEHIVKILENDALVTGISLIISVVVPIFVMIITLCVGGRRAKKESESKEAQFKETLKQNNLHHEDTLKKNDLYHKESMELQEENNRVSQLPFLFLNHDFKLENRNGRYTFPLEIINVGNGTALEISLKLESDEAWNIITGVPFVYKKQTSDGTQIYRFHDFLFTNALPVHSKASFSLVLMLYDNEEEVSQEDKPIGDEVKFTIKYKDTYYNEYGQDYMFQYSTKTGIGQVNSYLPYLIKKNAEEN